MSWSLDKESALRRVVAEADVPYHIALRALSNCGDSDVELEMVTHDLLKGRNPDEELGDA